jgi:uncharacterized protein (TIGR02145 family)
MKKNITSIVVMFLLALSVYAQNETMYIMKSGIVVGKYNINTQVDSIVFYKPQQTITDSRDGTVYQIVSIGTQVWMAENLRYLPQVHSNSEFAAAGTNLQPGYGVYGYNGNDVATAKAQPNYSTYGVLYNWYAVNTANVCPTGWHVPADAEWTTLITYLGGEYAAEGKLKETGTAHWLGTNDRATNESGFTALPGGYRYSTVFDKIGYNGNWWSASEYNSQTAFNRGMYNNVNRVTDGYSGKVTGYSVRCIKD